MANVTSANVHERLAPHVNGALLRSLGALEKYSVIRSRLGVYLNVCVTATYHRRCTDPLKAELFRALATVIQSHPILGAVPINNDAEFSFTRLDGIDLNQAVSFRDISNPDTALRNGDIDAILEEQHNNGFSSQGPTLPYWRLCVLSNLDENSSFVVIFCFHHALMDTKSALVFLEDLEHALSDPAGPKVPDTVVITSKEGIDPPLESLHALGASSEFLLQQQNQREPPANVWSGAPQTMPSCTRFCSLWLSTSLTSEILRQCKLQGTTLTALLMSLIARSCFEALGPEITELHGDCAVSIRRFFAEKLEERAMGCHVTAFNQAYSRGSSLWTDAKSTKANIDTTLGLKGGDSSAAYLQQVPDISQWLMAKQGKKRWPAWELSNVGTLGKIDQESSGSYVMQSVLFSQSASACSGAIKVSAASGRDKQLSLGISYQQGVVQEEMVKKVISNLEDWTDQVLHGIAREL